MTTLLLLLSTAFGGDDFDIADKKSTVDASGEYYSFDIHHKSPEGKYVYGYYVYEENRRDEVVALLESAVSEVNNNYVDTTCEKFDIAYFFVKNDIISNFEYPTTFVHTKDDFYLFVCSDCNEPEIDQLKSLYSQVFESSCNLPK
jgi:hypothetical protein